MDDYEDFCKFCGQSLKNNNFNHRYATKRSKYYLTVAAIFIPSSIIISILSLVFFIKTNPYKVLAITLLIMSIFVLVSGITALITGLNIKSNIDKR